MFDWSTEDKVVLPLTLLGIIVVTLIVWWLLRNKNEKIKIIPLIIIASIMLVLELCKQIISIREGYDLWHIPLHFCSLFIYWFPLMVFTREGRLKNFGTTMAFACSVSLLACFYCDPSAIIGGDTTANIFKSFFSFNTYTYHHLVFLFLFIGLALDMFKLDKTCFKHVITGITIYGIVAISFAYALDTNYCNLLVSQIDFVEKWRLQCGQVLYTIGVYTFGVVLGCVACAVKLLIQKRLNKKTTE